MTTPPVLVVEAVDVFDVVGGLEFRLEGIRVGTDPENDDDEPLLDLSIGIGSETSAVSRAGYISMVGEVNCRGEHRCLP